MKVVDLLKEDHQEIQGLFEILQGQREKSWETVKNLCEKLRLHLVLEEQYLYPALEEYRETADLVRKSYLQHNETKKLIKLILGENLGNEELDEKLEMLQVASLNHFQNENDELLTRAQRVLTDAEIEEIGKQIESKKKEVLNLP
jgi:hemerythrin-like domain-containing protein